MKTAAITIAFLGLIERVEIHVAIAFGASVQPLTRITPIVRIDITNNAKFENNCEIKSPNVIAILSPTIPFLI
ncbi:MAG: hypothetical protein LOD89_03220 [Tissierellales bacterium]